MSSFFGRQATVNLFLWYFICYYKIPCTIFFMACSQKPDQGWHSMKNRYTDICTYMYRKVAVRWAVMESYLQHNNLEPQHFCCAKHNGRIQLVLVGGLSRQTAVNILEEESIGASFCKHWTIVHKHSSNCMEVINICTKNRGRFS